VATLFVARDAQGLTRFVGDVPRGAACGCFCPVCNAALVAKQGDALDWHFAHEAGTERPECRAGAMNLLRRLAVEELNRRGLVLLPDFSVAHPLGGRAPIVWTAHPAGELQLLEAGGAQGPSATLPLREGGTALVFVCIDRETPHASHGPEQAVLVVWCPYPENGRIRSEAQARDFVRASVRLQWAFLPDYEGRVAAAEEERRAFLRQLQERAQQQAGARWGAMRRALQAPPLAREVAAVPPAAAPAPAPVIAPEWAPGLVVGTSIHYRAMDDGSQWVCYQSAANQWRLRAVPGPHDGWDESFPLTIAVPEGGAWLRVVDFGKLLMLFNAHATASRIDSDPGVIQRLFEG
jgi:hypothetical protein